MNDIEREKMPEREDVLKIKRTKFKLSTEKENKCKRTKDRQSFADRVKNEEKDSNANQKKRKDCREEKLTAGKTGSPRNVFSSCRKKLEKAIAHVIF